MNTETTHIKIVNRETGEQTIIAGYSAAEVVRKSVEYIAVNGWNSYEISFKDIE